MNIKERGKYKMVFLGYSFFGDMSSVLPTVTSINDINYVEVKDGLYDELYITNNTDEINTDEINEVWDFDTVLHANFDNTTDAGNIGWNLKNTTNILVKKREAGDLKWTTIYDQEVLTIEDFSFSGVDYVTKSNTDYQYAIVSALGRVEGNYNISEVTSEFDGIFLIEKDAIYGTPITSDLIDTTRNVPSTILSLPNNKYAVYCSNSIANYDTGSASGTFVYLNKETCTYDFEHVNQYTRYLMEMLSNRKAKLLKVYDGRMWLIMVSGNPTDTGESDIRNRIINFEWAEIGDYKSEKDLYWAGLSNVSSIWWNT